MASPTRRSLELLRKQGYQVAIVEHYNAFAHKRYDLFGFADVVGIKEDEDGVLAVQTTTTDNLSSRVHKILASPAARTWLMAKNRIWAIGWAKRGKQGKVKRWTPAIREISLGEFPEVIEQEFCLH